MTDVWHWRAEYSDGGALEEYDAGGTEHGFREIDQERLERLVLVPQFEGLTHHVLKLTGDARPIFFRRRSVSLDPSSGEQTPLGTIHCLGWQSTVQGHNVRAITAYFHDGSSLVTDDPESF